MEMKPVRNSWPVGRVKVEPFTCKMSETWILRRKPSWFARLRPAEKELVEYLDLSAERPANSRPKLRQENFAKISTTGLAASACDCLRCASGGKTFPCYWIGS